MRSTTSMSKSRGSSKQPNIKPSDVYELKLQTQQIQQKTTQMKTKLSRINDIITIQTNAINKTYEQQAETPPISQTRQSSVAILRRSVESAQNTLNQLQLDIEKAKKCDKTNYVRELQEEVRIVYCEHQRLTIELQDAKIEAHHSTQLCQEGERRVSSQFHNEYKEKIRDLQNTNASLRAKAVAYQSKKAKLEMEKQIEQHQQKKKPVDETIDESKAHQQELKDQLSSKVNDLQAQREEYEQKEQELRAIIEEQRQKIRDCLDGKIVPKALQHNEEEAEEEACEKEEEEKCE